MKKFIFATGSVAFLWWLASGKKSDVDIEVITPRQLPTDTAPVKPLPGGVLTPTDNETRDGSTQLPTNSGGNATPNFFMLNPM